MSKKILYTVVDQEQAYALRILIRQYRIMEIRALVELAAADPTRIDLVTATVLDVEDKLTALDQMVMMGQAADDTEWLFQTMFDANHVPPREENVELLMTREGKEQLLLMLADIPEPRPNAGPATIRALEFLKEEAEGLQEAIGFAEVLHQEYVEDDTEQIAPDATQRKPSYKQ